MEMGSEWDYENNYGVRPEWMSEGAECAVHWRCGKCGRPYKMKVREKMEGGECPYCSGKMVYDPKSLAAVAPMLADEWAEEFNDNHTPYNTKVADPYPVMWKCKICGGYWRDTISDRMKMNQGCPDCASRARQTSVPQLIICHYFGQMFPDTENRFRLNNKTEIDVYVPSIKLGIEYDGELFHSTRKDRNSDLNKNKVLRETGIELVRFREEKCFKMEDPGCRIISIDKDGNYLSLQDALQTFIDEIRVRFGIKKRIKVDVDSILADVNKQVYDIPEQSSLAYFLEHRIKDGKNEPAYWDYEANYPLTPAMFTKRSNKMVKWVCRKDPSHKWGSAINNVSAGNGCPKCNCPPRRNTEEWIQAARAVHGDKYDYSKVVFVNAKTPVTIICPEHGEFQERPDHHLEGHGCKYCGFKR
jgi:DNA-directed RNA polymerase subunit RPC12/RpoP